MAGGKLLGALATAAMALSVAGTACAQAVVVRATGPSMAKYPKGTKLPAGATVSLQDGDVLTVLDRVGTRVIKGRGSYAIDSQVLRDRGMVNVLSRTLSNPRTIRAGAVRGIVPSSPNTPPMAPRSVWLADIDKGGKVCVPQGSGLYLWRGTNGAQRLSWLSEAEGGAMVKLQFPPQTSGISWPSGSLPLVAGRSYRINGDGVGEPTVEFEVVSLAPDAIPDNAADLGSLLLANGCSVQFDVLADSLIDDAGTGG